MKYNTLTKANQQLLEALEVAGSKDRRKSARHGKQFASDPKSKGPKSKGVNVWEFLVDPMTPVNGPFPGAFRMLRRQQESDVTWWWAKHLGDGKSFSFEQITDIPSFKPVREVVEEDTDESATEHTTNVLSRAETMTVVKEEVPESWEDEA
jgi:hypothetical protein